MAELHSVTGLFYEAFPGISPWGGFFTKGAEIEDPTGIEGSLVDRYGPSTIIGAMNPEKLEFQKQYLDCNGNQCFDYTFVLKNGIWQGEYQSTQTSYSGRSICKTNPIFKNLKFKRVDLSDPEQYFQALLENMVDTGMLEIIKDPKTREELFPVKQE